MYQARRKYPRATLRGTVQINIPGHRVTGELMTLSQGGCFVINIDRLKVGAEYRMFLLVTSVKNPIELIGKVLYNLPAMDGHEAGTGFCFTKVSPEDEAHVEEAVKKSGELYQRLLFALTDSSEDPDEIERLCREAGLPDGLTLAQLRWRVVQSVSQFRG